MSEGHSKRNMSSSDLQDIIMSSGKKTIDAGTDWRKLQTPYAKLNSFRGLSLGPFGGTISNLDRFSDISNNFGINSGGINLDNTSTSQRLKEFTPGGASTSRTAKNMSIVLPNDESKSYALENSNLLSGGSRTSRVAQAPALLKSIFEKQKSSQKFFESIESKYYKDTMRTMKGERRLSLIQKGGSAAVNASTLSRLTPTSNNRFKVMSSIPSSAKQHSTEPSLILHPSRLADKLTSQKSQLRNKLNTTQFSVKGTIDNRISILTGFKEVNIVSSDDESDQDQAHNPKYSLMKDCDIISRISKPKHQDTNMSSINLGNIGTPKTLLEGPQNSAQRNNSHVIQQIPERDQGNVIPKQSEESEETMLDRAPSTDSAGVHEDDCRETFICSNTKVTVGANHQRSSSRNQCEMSKFSAATSNNMSIISKPPKSKRSFGGSKKVQQGKAIMKLLSSEYDYDEMQGHRSPKSSNDSGNYVILQHYRQAREKVKEIRVPSEPEESNYNSLQFPSMPASDPHSPPQEIQEYSSNQHQAQTGSVVVDESKSDMTFAEATNNETLQHYVNEIGGNRRFPQKYKLAPQSQEMYPHYFDSQACHSRMSSNGLSSEQIEKRNQILIQPTLDKQQPYILQEEFGNTGEWNTEESQIPMMSPQPEIVVPLSGMPSPVDKQTKLLVRPTGHHHPQFQYVMHSYEQQNETPSLTPRQLSSLRSSKAGQCDGSSLMKRSVPDQLELKRKQAANGKQYSIPTTRNYDSHVVSKAAEYLEKMKMDGHVSEQNIDEHHEILHQLYLLKRVESGQDDFVETVKPNARQMKSQDNFQKSQVASSQLKTRTFSIPAHSYNSNMTPLHAQPRQQAMDIPDAELKTQLDSLDLPDMPSQRNGLRPDNQHLYFNNTVPLESSLHTSIMSEEDVEEYWEENETEGEISMQASMRIVKRHEALETPYLNPSKQFYCTSPPDMIHNSGKRGRSSLSPGRLRFRSSTRKKVRKYFHDAQRKLNFYKYQSIKQQESNQRMRERVMMLEQKIEEISHQKNQVSNINLTQIGQLLQWGAIAKLIEDLKSPQTESPKLIQLLQHLISPGASSKSQQSIRSEEGAQVSHQFSVAPRGCFSERLEESEEGDLMSKEKLLSINERLVQQLEHNMQTLSELNQEILERDQKMMSNERELKTREKQVLSLKNRLKEVSQSWQKILEQGMQGHRLTESRNTTPVMNISDQVHGFPSSNNTSMRLPSNRHGHSTHSVPAHSESGRPLPVTLSSLQSRENSSSPTCKLLARPERDLGHNPPRYQTEQHRHSDQLGNSSVEQGSVEHMGSPIQGTQNLSDTQRRMLYIFNQVPTQFKGTSCKQSLVMRSTDGGIKTMGSSGLSSFFKLSESISRNTGATYQPEQMRELTNALNSINLKSPSPTGKYQEIGREQSTMPTINSIENSNNTLRSGPSREKMRKEAKTSAFVEK